MAKYRHYKGWTCTLLTFAQHAETGEDLVIYQNKHGEVFARSHDTFFGEVEVDSKSVPRFEEIAVKEIVPRVSVGRNK